MTDDRTQTEGRTPTDGRCNPTIRTATGRALRHDYVVSVP